MTSTGVAQMGFWDLISQSGPVAKLVLLVLLSASIVTWGIILSKWRSLRSAIIQNDGFLEAFWNGKNLDEILARIDQYPHSPVASVFRSGVKEFKKLTASGEAQAVRSEGVDNIHRALNRATNTEVTGLENHVSWLATVASAAPFVGLFGTVWGIMNSFQSIGATGAANLAVVAPGISEALITTAAGILAAIPAVIGYNHFVGKIKRITVDIESFTQDFLNIIQRSALSGGSGPARKEV